MLSAIQLFSPDKIHAHVNKYNYLFPSPLLLFVCIHESTIHDNCVIANTNAQNDFFQYRSALRKSFLEQIVRMVLHYFFLTHSSSPACSTYHPTCTVQGDVPQ